MSSKPKKPAAVAVQPQVAAESSKRVARVTETTLALAATSGYYDQLAALSHENFDAVIKANAALMEGFEAIANDAVDYARQTLATAGTATKEMLAAKTLDRVIEIQTGLAKNGLEALVERTARLSELGLALASGTWAPIGGCGVKTTLTKLARPVTA